MVECFYWPQDGDTRWIAIKKRWKASRVSVLIQCTNVFSDTRASFNGDSNWILDSDAEASSAEHRNVNANDEYFTDHIVVQVNWLDWTFTNLGWKDWAASTSLSTLGQLWSVVGDERDANLRWIIEVTPAHISGGRPGQPITLKIQHGNISKRAPVFGEINRTNANPSSTRKANRIWNASCSSPFFAWSPISSESRWKRSTFE